jgi:lipoprotein-anchoring transpeptidase ErfK/SrfK
MLPRFVRGILPAILLTSLLAACGQVQTRASVEANARVENQSLFGLFQIARIPRETVPFAERHQPGTIVIKTSERRLYYVLGNGQAIRYGIGVGRDGFRWSGVETVSMKKEWPDWTPPEQMLKRRPDLPRHMDGGPENPLGARAMYLGSSFYRIHGSNEEYTIGGADSSGCIRMTNSDVIDLYNRVKVGSTVIVKL